MLHLIMFQSSQVENVKEAFGGTKLNLIAKTLQFQWEVYVQV